MIDRERILYLKYYNRNYIRNVSQNLSYIVYALCSDCAFTARLQFIMFSIERQIESKVNQYWRCILPCCCRWNLQYAAKSSNREILKFNEDGTYRNREYIGDINNSTVIDTDIRRLLCINSRDSVNGGLLTCTLSSAIKTGCNFFCYVNYVFINYSYIENRFRSASFIKADSNAAR